VSSDTLGVDPTNFASAPSESVDPLGHRTERRESPPPPPHHHHHPPQPEALQEKDHYDDSTFKAMRLCGFDKNTSRENVIPDGWK